MNQSEKEKKLRELLWFGFKKGILSKKEVRDSLEKVIMAKEKRLQKIGRLLSSFSYEEVNEGLILLYQEVKSFSYAPEGSPFFLKQALSSSEREKNFLIDRTMDYVQKLTKLSELACSQSPFFGYSLLFEAERLSRELDSFEVSELGKEFPSCYSFRYFLGRTYGAALFGLSKLGQDERLKVEDKLYFLATSTVETVPYDFVEGVFRVLAEKGYEAKTPQLVKALFEKAVDAFKDKDVYLLVAGENLLREYSTLYLKEVFRDNNSALSVITSFESAVEKKKETKKIREREIELNLN